MSLFNIDGMSGCRDVGQCDIQRCCGAMGSSSSSNRQSVMDSDVAMGISSSSNRQSVIDSNGER